VDREREAGLAGKAERGREAQLERGQAVGEGVADRLRRDPAPSHGVKNNAGPSFLCARSAPMERKGTSVMITSEGPVMKLSARNQIPARVTGIQAGEAIANVELDANGVRMVASITLEAVKQLGLTEGSDVVAIIKASDVIVAVAD
jgi:molybdopterin-binding protein